MTAAMPAELAAGPELARWADPAARLPQHSALRAWQAAVRAWAVEAGMTGAELASVENLARRRTAYSRSWLITDGRRELVDYYEGRRSDEPESTEWRPSVAPSAP